MWLNQHIPVVVDAEYGVFILLLIQFSVASAVTKFWVYLWIKSFQLRPVTAQYSKTHLNRQQYKAQKPGLMVYALLSHTARKGPRGSRQQKGETVRWCKFSHLQTHYSKQICPKRYLFSVKRVTKQYFPWFKAGLMWQRFKSNSLGAGLTKETKWWVEMSFPFRIQFCLMPWIDKIPKSQK